MYARRKLIRCVTLKYTHCMLSCFSLSDSLLPSGPYGPYSPWLLCPWDFPSKNTKRKKSEVTQSCPTLCNSMNYTLPGSSVHGIFQVRILELVAISFSRRSSWPREWTRVSHIVDRRFTAWAIKEVKNTKVGCYFHLQGVFLIQWWNLLSAAL